MSAEAVSTANHPDDDRLRARIQGFIAGSSSDDFDALALASHAYQYRSIPAYRRFVDRVAAGAAPAGWLDLPAVPADAFKETALAGAPAVRVYESSGTTAGPERRSHHHVPFPELYRTAALVAFTRSVLPAGERRPFVVAAPERETHPRSSLGEMVTWIREAHDAGGPPGFLHADGLDLEGLATALGEAPPDRPLLLFAVTAALLRLADHGALRGASWRLPAGSLVVDTGGCKGYPVDVPRRAVLGRYAAAFGTTPAQVVNEYGMSELSSQFYARGTEPFVPPPWVRTVVIDPETGAPAGSGGVGLLRHVDLANFGSVVAVQTEDVGRVAWGGFELLGRVAGAEPRGCSLLASR